MTSQKKSGPGRPAVDTQPVTIRLPTSMIKKIDKLRGQEENPPTRQIFIRRHLAEWLEIDD
jgi:Arc/MetJ-type ribon-helix-helix transcriptional regulator